MNKKFLSAILFGALVASTGSFVSCADNDDKIDQLQDQNSELKAQLAQLKSELQAELKNAASASQVAAIEAKLSAIEGVTSDNIAATVAALKGNFDTQEARVIALETQIKALEGLKDVDASELIAVLNKAKENGTADMTGLSALVDALDAQVNTLISDLRSIVFQPEFYVDGIEAVEYTYLKYIALDPEGDTYNEHKAFSVELSEDEVDYATGVSYSYFHYDARNKKFNIDPKFVWGYAHEGDLTWPDEPMPKGWNHSSMRHPDRCNYYGTLTGCAADGCLEPNDEWGAYYALPNGVHDYVGKDIINTMYFAINPANAKVEKEDLLVAVKNVCAMTRANAEVTITSVEPVVDAKDVYAGAASASKNEKILRVDYYISNPKDIITANNDESLSALNKIPNTTIFKLQADAEGGYVESDWAALYETQIQPVAVALNPYAAKAHAGLNAWYAPINCCNTLPNELHKNPYEAAADTMRTTEIDYLSEGVDIAKHIELHFIKRDNEKADRKHAADEPEKQHPHVTMTLAEAAYRFGFTYEFKLVPFVIDDNETNDSSYGHLKDGLYGNSIFVPNTVDEERAAIDKDKYAYIPKKATEKSQASKDGYEQGASSVDKEPLVQILVKKGNDVILDAYVSFIITRTVGNIMAPVFDLGSADKGCADITYKQTWNQVSELLYEQTANKGLGMSKLEFEETYELAKYDMTDANSAAVQFKVAEKDGFIEATPILYDNTYTEVKQEFDPNGITNTVLKLTLDKYDQQYVYEKENHTDIIYVMYVRRGTNSHSTFNGIVVPLKIALDEVKAASYVALNSTFWYKDGVTPDVNGVMAGRENVNHPLDNTNTFEYKYASDQPEEFTHDPIVSGLKETGVLGFVRDINDAWMGKKLNFSGLNKKDSFTKEKKPTYYFHPANRGYEFVSENNGNTYVLDIDNVNIECAIWCDGDNPQELTGKNKHNHTIVPDAAKAYAEDPMIIKNTEKNHQVNTLKGIYTNVYLYCYEKGKKPAKYTEDDVIAEMNRYTGKIHYRYNEMSKLALNTQKHTVANLKAKVGIFLPNECDMAYYINNDTISTNDFDLYYYRPIDIDVNDGYVTDAVNNADYIQLAKCFEFSDWRDYKFFDPAKANPYENIWLLAFYGVKDITVDFANATTDMNDQGWNILAKANEDVVLSYVDYDKKTVIADLDKETAAPEKGTHTVDLRTSGLNKASKGVKSTYDYVQEHFGYIKYMNKGANLSNYHIKVPVTFGYDWGEITRTVLIHVNGTEGNHTADGECHVK